MSIISSIPGTVSVLISLVNQAYLTIISAIWYYAVYFGLSPNYAFPVGIQGNQSFVAFYNLLFRNVYLNLAGLLVLIASFLFVVSNSLGRIHLPTALVYRLIFGFSLAFFSFRICILIMKFSLVIFMQIWGHSGIDWYSLFSVQNTVKQIEISHSTDPFFGVMEFLLLSGYFVGTGTLLAILEIRQALVIFLILTMPLFSSLFIIRGADSLAWKFWKLFVEINILPFFILVMLYGIHLFPGNFLLQLSFIFLAASSPYLLVSASSVFGSGLSSVIFPKEFTSTPLTNPAASLAGIGGKSGGIAGFMPGKGTGGPLSLDSHGGQAGADSALMKDFEYRRF